MGNRVILQVRINKQAVLSMQSRVIRQGMSKQANVLVAPNPKQAALGYMAKNEDYMWKRIKHQLIQKVVKQTCKIQPFTSEQVEDFIYQDLKELLIWLKKDKVEEREKEKEKARKEIEIHQKYTKLKKETYQVNERVKRRDQKIVKMQKAISDFMKKLRMVEKVEANQLINNKKSNRNTDKPKSFCLNNLENRMPIVLKSIVHFLGQELRRHVQKQNLQQILLQKFLQIVKIKDRQLMEQQQKIVSLLNNEKLIKQILNQRVNVQQKCKYQYLKAQKEVTNKQKIARQLRLIVESYAQQNIKLNKQLQKSQNFRDDLEQSLIRLQEQHMVLLQQNRSLSSFISKIKSNGWDNGYEIKKLGNTQKQEIIANAQEGKPRQLRLTSNIFSYYNEPSIKLINQSQQQESEQSFIEECDIGVQYQSNLTCFNHTQAQTKSQKGLQMETQTNQNWRWDLDQSLRELQWQNSELKKNNQQLLETIEYANSLFNSSGEQQGKFKFNCHHLNGNCLHGTPTLTDDSADKSDKDETHLQSEPQQQGNCPTFTNVLGHQTESSDSNESKQVINGQNGAQSRYGAAVARILADFISPENGEQSRMSAFATLVELLQPGVQIAQKLNGFARLRRSRNKMAELIQPNEKQEQSGGLKDKLYKFLTSN